MGGAAVSDSGKRMNLPEAKEPTSSSALLFDRVGPPGQRGTWRWKSQDDGSAIAVVNELRSYLDRELATWNRFLDRDMLLQAASEQDGVSAAGSGRSRMVARRSAWQ